jgi:hypothetical protein
MKVWVLTKEYNLYDQEGEYFVAVFANKPTTQQLEECSVPYDYLQHVLNGGGRLNIEEEWFYLREVETKG